MTRDELIAYVSRLKAMIHILQRSNREALNAADERPALIEDVGHGAHSDNVTVARGLISKALTP